MKERHFDTFKEAQSFAKNMAEFFRIGSRLRRSGEIFIVSTHEKAHPDKLQSFSRSVFYDRMSPDQLKSILDYAASPDLMAETLAWFDAETKLTWDSSRLLCNQGYTDFPGYESKKIMNFLGYAGLTGWRIPTLNELKTLNLDKLRNAGINFKTSSEGEINFWSSDPEYSGPDEKAFLDFASMRIGYQYFKEQHRDRNTSGDGYKESGQIILVTTERTTPVGR